MRIGSAAGVAVLIAAATLGSPSLLAADLGRPYAAVPYDDPRYAEPYGHSVPPPPVARGYEDYDDPRFVPPPGYREGRILDEDDEDGDDAGVPEDRDYGRHPRAFVGVEPDRLLPSSPPPADYRLADRGYVCLSSAEIRHRLRAQGWRRFRDLALAGQTGIVRATRRGGFDEFELRVDRCSGAVVGVTPLGGRRYGYYEPRYDDPRFGK